MMKRVRTIAYGLKPGKTYIWQGKDDFVDGLAETENVLPPSDTLVKVALVAQNVDSTGCDEAADFCFPLREQSGGAHNKCDGRGVERGGGEVLWR